MDVLGSLKLVAGGSIENLRIENLAGNPVSPYQGQMWYVGGELRYYDGTSVLVIATGGSTGELQSEIDAIETGAGLNTDGTYTAPGGTNYLGSATSLKNADTLLDTQVKANADAIALVEGQADDLQLEIDAIETGAGLNTDGTYTAPVGTNYLGGATSLKQADTLLDTQVKTNTDDISDLDLAVSGKVSKSGDSMSGNLAFGGTSKVTGLAAPTNAEDAATKQYVDAAVSGLDIQADVLNIQTDDTLDPGASPTSGDRYIITNAASLHANFGTIAGVANNDIVQYNGSAFVVAYDVSVAGEGALVWDRFSDSFYFYGGSSWSAFGGLAGVTAGVGLSKTGNTLDVNLGAGIAQLPTDEVGVDVYTTGGLFLTVNGTDASTDTAAQLSVKLDGATLARSSSGLKIADGGVGATQIHADAIGNGLAGGSGVALEVDAGTGIIVDGTGVNVDTDYLDGLYLGLGGGTLTGALVLAADPTANLGAATKQYVDAVTTALEASTFVYTGGTAQTTHVVTHNIGSQYCNVTVVDSDDKVIIPDEITFDTADQLTVTFASAITCKVIVTGKYVEPI